MSTTTLHRVQSETRPSQTYLVEEKNGRLTCECPSFRFDRHRSKSCKHVELMRDEPESVLITRDVQPDTTPAKPWYAARHAAPTRQHDARWESSPAPDGVTTSLHKVEEILADAQSLRHEVVLTSWGTIVGQSTKIPEFGDNECTVLLHRVEVAEFLRGHDDLTTAAAEILRRAKEVSR